MGLSHPLQKVPRSLHLIFECSRGLGFLSSGTDGMGGLAVGRSLRFTVFPVPPCPMQSHEPPDPAAPGRADPGADPGPGYLPTRRQGAL